MTRNERLQLVGWVMFIVCAVLYTWDSIAAGSVVGTAGSLIFLAACFVFIIPLFSKSDR